MAALDSGARAFRRVIDKRSFDPGMFIMEFFMTTSVEEKRVFLDLVVEAIRFAEMRQDATRDSELRQVYDTLIKMGNGLSM